MEEHHPGCGVLAAPSRRRRRRHYHEDYFKGVGVAFTSEARRKKAAVKAVLSILGDLQHLPEDQQVQVIVKAMVDANCVAEMENFTRNLWDVIERTPGPGDLPSYHD